MTPEEQRIAIAETQGFQVYDEHVVKPDGTPVDCEFLTEEGVNNIFPDYPNDLNSMHEVEKSFPSYRYLAYVEQLKSITGFVGENDLSDGLFLMLHATAAQRAEAYLRTKGLWKD